MGKKIWTVEEKVAILHDIEKIGVREGCRKHGIYPDTYYKWLDKYTSQGIEGLEVKPSRYRLEGSKGDLDRLSKENRLLKELLAEKELELKFKDDLLKKRIAEWKSSKKQ